MALPIGHTAQSLGKAVFFLDGELLSHFRIYIYIYIFTSVSCGFYLILRLK